MCVVCTNFIHSLSAAPHHTWEISDALHNSRTSNKETSKTAFYLCPVERQLFATCANLLLNSLVCNSTAFNHTSQPSAAQQLANPDYLCCTDAEFAPLTSWWVWGHYLCELPMFLITRVFFFLKPWLRQGRNKLVLKCKSVRCQHSNARLEFMCLQTKGDTERSTAIKQTGCTAKGLYMQGTPPGKGLKDKFLRVPDLCLSAPIFSQLFGQVPLCNRLSKK